jgi:hypothetical protein
MIIHAGDISSTGSKNEIRVFLIGIVNYLINILF